MSAAASTPPGSYKDFYRHTFANLARPLTARDGVSEAVIADAEREFGIRLPRALRDYYLVAGSERVLNQEHNRLLEPEEWEIHSGKLIFMEENQSVVVWAVAASSESDDPAVFQSPMVGGEPSSWHREHERCSVFLATMLHWQAVSGGMSSIASASVPETLRTTLDSTWHFAGEINRMRAYNREGRAVCFLEWFGPWKVFAGASSKRDLDSVAKDLGLQWD